MKKFAINFECETDNQYASCRGVKTSLEIALTVWGVVSNIQVQEIEPEIDPVTAFNELMLYLGPNPMADELIVAMDAFVKRFSNEV